MTDPGNLERFVAAQRPVYHDVVRELAVAKSGLNEWGSFFPKSMG
jgi:uncharacterized protein (DUF1810 family)